MTNAIAISRNLSAHLATQADIADLKGEIKAVAAQMKILTGLVIGLYVSFAVVVISIFLK